MTLAVVMVRIRDGVVQVGELRLVRLVHLLDDDAGGLEVDVGAAVGDVVGDPHAGGTAVGLHALRPKAGVHGGGSVVGMVVDHRSHRRQSVQTVAGGRGDVVLAMGSVEGQHLDQGALLVLELLELFLQFDVLSF